MKPKYLLISLLILLAGREAHAEKSPEWQTLWEAYQEIKSRTKLKGGVKEALRITDNYLRQDLSEYPDLEVHALSTKISCHIQLNAIDSANFYLAQATKISQQHGIDSLPQIPRLKGITATLALDIKGARDWFKRGLAMADKYQNESERIRCVYYLGRNFLKTQQIDSSIFYNQLGLGFTAANDVDRETLSGICYTLSMIESQKNNLAGAIEYLFRGYEMSVENTGENSAAYQTYLFRLAHTYGVLGNFPKALELLEEHISHNEKNNSKMNMQPLYSWRISLLLELNRIEEAEKALVDMARDFDVNRHPIFLNMYNSAVGHLHYRKGEWEEAEVYLAKSLPSIELFAKQPTPTLSAEGAFYLTKLYHHQGRYQEAIRIGEIMLASEQIAYHNRTAFQQILAACYEKTGDYEKAYQLLRQRDIIRDTIDQVFAGAVRLTKEQEILDRERAQEKERAKVANELAELKADRQRSLFLAAGIFLAALLIIVYSWGRQRKLQLENTLVGVKQELLKLQVNPHFIFNALNSIQNSVLNMDKEKSVELISKFSKLSRQVLENSDQIMVPIHEEVQLLTNYMDLEKVRTQNKFDYEIDIDPSIDVYNESIPSMMLQLFVENAIWHGILPKEGKGLIQLKFTKEKGRVRVAIEDDGIGRQKSIANKSPDQKERTSMGMRLVRERIAALNKKYRKRIELLVQNGSNGQGTAVFLTA